MEYHLRQMSTIIIGLLVAAIHFQPTLADDNSSKEDKEDDKESRRLPLTFVWTLKPPYVTPPSNGSLDNGAHGMIRDALLKHVIWDCGWLGKLYDVNTLRVDSEFEMLNLLRQNKVHIAVPIFEHPTSPRYSEFPFFKMDDYPGTEYIISIHDLNALSIVLEAVVKAWPLLAVTMVLTAIAGVIMWALDTYWNSDEFPRSFIKGSWDGFWWSFISMTTVGYGDKSPKSIVARIFSIIWIMLGLIAMAIFTATVTSALTAVSLELTPSSLVGLKVGVLSNGTEYKHALHEGADPQVYTNIEELIQDLDSKEIQGMLLDHYAASYYQSREKLKSLIIVTKFEFRRDVGVIFSKDRTDLADCLNFHRSDIWRKVQTITSTYKLNQQKPTKSVSLFDDSAQFVKQFIYISLGVFGGLLLLGTLWDIFSRKKTEIKEDVELGTFNSGMLSEREINRKDVVAARALLKQMEEHLNTLEAKVSKF